MMREIAADSSRAVPAPHHKPVPARWDPNTITAAWLGHSTVLLNFYGLTILTDPALFMRVGADVGIGTVGPKRLIAPALGAGCASCRQSTSYCAFPCAHGSSRFADIEMSSC